MKTTSEITQEQIVDIDELFGVLDKADWNDLPVMKRFMKKYGGRALVDAIKTHKKNKALKSPERVVKLKDGYYTVKENKTSVTSRMEATRDVKGWGDIQHLAVNQESHDRGAKKD